jgi:hypothetical protein
MGSATLNPESRFVVASGLRGLRLGTEIVEGRTAERHAIGVKSEFQSPEQRHGSVKIFGMAGVTTTRVFLHFLTT